MEETKMQEEPTTPQTPQEGGQPTPGQDEGGQSMPGDTPATPPAGTPTEDGETPSEQQEGANQ